MPSVGKEYVLYNGRLQRVRTLRLDNQQADDISTFRKLTSMRYLSNKVRGWFHREERESCVSAALEAEEEEMCRRSLRDIVCCEELMQGLEKTTVLTSDREDRRSSITTMTTSTTRSSIFTDTDTSRSSLSFSGDELPIETSVMDQRCCFNCHSTFQRQLSHYDHYCGLDCKTAHRVRLSS
ncbi:hypothetical protein ATCC90586_002259 [Pythium insidiosum]|nr:hypothetical protein ATCC90586_002259 [Pythium insidiosum]